MLKQKARTAILWAGGDVMVRQGIQTFVAIALARLLTPEIFGTVALLSIFVALAELFVDSGFSSALIRKQDVTHADESTVFWFNLAIGVAVALILLAIGPWIAWFYSLPILTPLAAVMALNIVLSALGSLQGALLNKKLDFRSRMRINVAATVASSVTAVSLAWGGFGVWSLAAQAVSATAVSTGLLWILSPWRPGWIFSLGSAKELFGFGGYLLLSGVVAVVYDHGYSLLIGKFYGTRDLGFFGRAGNVQQIPAGLLAGIISRVTYPLLSAASGDKVQMMRAVRMAVRSAMLVNVPMMLGLFAVARPLVPILLGSQWTPIVPLLQVLCLYGIFWPLHVINLDALLAQGHSRLFLRLTLMKNMGGAVFLLTGSYFGLLGLAWAQVLYGVIAFFINAYYTGKILGYGALDQLQDMLPVTLVSVFMAGVVLYAGSQWPTESPLKLISMVAVGAGVFFLVAFAVKLVAMHEALKILRGAR
jgi:teichuronic acid exporter